MAQTRSDSPTPPRETATVLVTQDAYPDPVGDIGSKVWKWVKRASVIGAALSLAIHLVVMLLAGWLTVRYPNADAGGVGPGAEVDFAVMTESELAAMLPEADNQSDPLVPEADVAVEPAITELTEATTTTESLTESSLEIEIDTGAGDIGDREGGGLTTGTGGGGGASFFGLEAQGSRFAYIVDRSSSMRGEKMDHTRAELTRSVTGLMENGEFLVIFYSDSPEVLGSRLVWRDASERSKADARRQIARVEPMGGTKPLGAFEMVFGQRVRPDAIYFMTDGKFSDDIPDRVAALNDNARIPIHCILFGEPSRNSVIATEVATLMRRIAADSGGQFRHVEVIP
jgi:hypothetical protein